jgi:hypothetical protein
MQHDTTFHTHFHSHTSPSSYHHSSRLSSWPGALQGTGTEERFVAAQRKYTRHENTNGPYNTMGLDPLCFMSDFWAALEKGGRIEGRAATIALGVVAYHVGIYLWFFSFSLPTLRSSPFFSLIPSSHSAGLGSGLVGRWLPTCFSRARKTTA